MRGFITAAARQGGEFLVNTDSNPCANPAVAAASDGSFMVAWYARDMVNYANGWIFMRVHFPRMASAARR